MKTRERLSRTFLILIGDVFIVPISYVAGYHLRLKFGVFPSKFSEMIPLSFLFFIILIYLTIFYFFDLYQLRKNYFTVHSFGRITISVLVAALFVSFLKYGFFLFPIGRGIFILANIIILISIFLWRGVCYRLFKYLIRPKSLIIVGAGKKGQEIARVIKSTVNDFEILGFLDDDEGKKEKYFPKQ